MNKMERNKVEKAWREGGKIYITKDLYVFNDKDISKGEFYSWEAYKEFNPADYTMYTDFVNDILDYKINIA